MQKIRLTAQVDLIEEYIARVEGELATIPVPAPDEPDLSGIEALIRDGVREVGELRQEIASLEGERVLALREAERVASESEDARGLVERFKLLQEHYRSDLARLNALAEAGYRLALLPSAVCPMCGVPTESRMPAPDGTGTGPTDEEFQTACEAEAKKIGSHERGLTAAVGDLDRRIAALDEDGRRAAATIAGLAASVEAAAKRLQQRSARLGEMIVRQAVLERRSSLEAQLKAYQSSRAERVLAKTPAAGKQVQRFVGLTTELRELCGVVRRLLDAWKFPDRGPVSFDLTTLDLTIGGKARSSYGKGLRAITHAAFTVALRLYCHERAIPHPGPVILDSPLVTYRKRNVRKGEALPEDIKIAFFEDLAVRAHDEQVIIFDNEVPPDSVADRVHNVFLDAADGPYRGGFIPPGPRPETANS